MSRRELVVLGTASQVPTRTRNHNGHVLFWDDDAILFDPGEGASGRCSTRGLRDGPDADRDHPPARRPQPGAGGVAQRISLDGVPHSIPVSFPASGAAWVDHLLDATSYHHRADLVLQPLSGSGMLPVVGREPGFTLRAERLDHGVEAFGYRLDEPEGRRMVPELLARAGVAGPAVGALQKEGSW
ncbi:hypothetical protein NKG05_07335 [Oerskovia sp. M15]